MAGRKRKREGPALRDDIRREIERAWPDGVVEMPDFEESWFCCVAAALDRDLRRAQRGGFSYERSPETVPIWADGADRDEDPPLDVEPRRSYHLFFYSPAGDEFAFESETEEYVEPEDYDEDSAGEPEFSMVTVAGEGRVGWTVAVSLVVPVAVITLSQMTTFDDGAVGEPSIETYAETEDGVRITNQEADFRQRKGDAAFAVLAQLRAKFVRILEKRGITVLPEDEWRKPVPWLRASEDTFIGMSGQPLRVLDAFFFEGS